MKTPVKPDGLTVSPEHLLQQLRDTVRFANPEEPGEILIIRPGKPLFTKDDLVGRHLNPHDKILRVACIRNGITEEHFSECFNQYAIEVLHEFPTKIYHQKLNLLRAIRKGGITSGRFYTTICDVLRGQVEEQLITIRFPGTKPQDYRMSEISRMIPIPPPVAWTDED
jgi:hypothetical protein